MRRELWHSHCCRENLAVLRWIGWGNFLTCVCIPFTFYLPLTTVGAKCIHQLWTGVWCAGGGERHVQGILRLWILQIHGLPQPAPGMPCLWLLYIQRTTSRTVTAVELSTIALWGRVTADLPHEKGACSTRFLVDCPPQKLRLCSIKNKHVFEWLLIKTA